MKIAVLAWGSLIYNPRINLATEWQSSSLYLPLEFSRVSHKGEIQDCLSLVIDAAHGSLCPVSFAESRLTNLTCAIDELAERERVTYRTSIGYVNLKRDTVNPVAEKWYADHCENIKNWARSQGIEGVIWTNLKANFEEKLGVPFTPSAALNYINRLPEDRRAKALTYIRQAPSFVSTRLRYLTQQGLLNL
jgi:hypothetical protein